MYQVRTITDPDFEPVSLSLAKYWTRVEQDDTNNDVVLRLLIKALREDAENRTGRAFITRQLRLTLDNWPWDSVYGVRICLPYPPLVSVDAFRYVDTDGVTQTLAADQYDVHDEYEPAIVIPAWGVTLPTIRAVPNALQIDYTAGYAPGSPPDEAGSQEVLPASLKHWLNAKLSTLFDRRDELVVGNVVRIPRDYTDGLLDSLVVGSRLF